MNKELEILKTEYANEIENLNVSIKDLKESNLSSRAIKSELYLRQIYADKIYENKLVDNASNKQKSVKKISQDDIGLNSLLKEICLHIDESSFDEKLDIISK